MKRRDREEGSSYRQWVEEVRRYGDKKYNEKYEEEKRYWKQVMEDYEGDKIGEKGVLGERSSIKVEFSEKETREIIRKVIGHIIQR